MNNLPGVHHRSRPSLYRNQFLNPRTLHVPNSSSRVSSKSNTLPSNVLSRPHGSQFSTLQDGGDQDYFINMQRSRISVDGNRKRESQKQRINAQAVMLTGCFALMFVVGIIMFVAVCYQNGWLGLGSRKSQVDNISKRYNEELLRIHKPISNFPDIQHQRATVPGRAHIEYRRLGLSGRRARTVNDHQEIRHTSSSTLNNPNNELPNSARLVDNHQTSTITNRFFHDSNPQENLQGMQSSFRNEGTMAHGSPRRLGFADNKQSDFDGMGNIFNSEDHFAQERLINTHIPDIHDIQPSFDKMFEVNPTDNVQKKITNNMLGLKRSEETVLLNPSGESLVNFDGMGQHFNSENHFAQERLINTYIPDTHDIQPHFDSFFEVNTTDNLQKKITNNLLGLKRGEETVLLHPSSESLINNFETINLENSTNLSSELGQRQLFIGNSEDLMHSQGQMQTSDLQGNPIIFMSSSSDDDILDTQLMVLDSRSGLKDSMSNMQSKHQHERSGTHIKEEENGMEKNENITPIIIINSQDEGKMLETLLNMRQSGTQENTKSQISKNVMTENRFSNSETDVRQGNTFSDQFLHGLFDQGNIENENIPHDFMSNFQRNPTIAPMMFRNRNNPNNFQNPIMTRLQENKVLEDLFMKRLQESKAIDDSLIKNIQGIPIPTVSPNGMTSRLLFGLLNQGNINENGNQGNINLNGNSPYVYDYRSNFQGNPNRSPVMIGNIQGMIEDTLMKRLLDTNEGIDLFMKMFQGSKAIDDSLMKNIEGIPIPTMAPNGMTSRLLFGLLNQGNINGNGNQGNINGNSNSPYAYDYRSNFQGNPNRGPVMTGNNQRMIEDTLMKMMEDTLMKRLLDSNEGNDSLMRSLQLSGVLDDSIIDRIQKSLKKSENRHIISEFQDEKDPSIIINIHGLSNDESEQTEFNKRIKSVADIPLEDQSSDLSDKLGLGLFGQASTPLPILNKTLSSGYNFTFLRIRRPLKDKKEKKEKEKKEKKSKNPFSFIFNANADGLNANLQSGGSPQDEPASFTTGTGDVTSALESIPGVGRLLQNFGINTGTFFNEQGSLSAQSLGSHRSDSNENPVVPPPPLPPPPRPPPRRPPVFRRRRPNRQGVVSTLLNNLRVSIPQSLSNMFG